MRKIFTEVIEESLPRRKQKKLEDLVMNSQYKSRIYEY